jgi:L-lysine 2,3-aminomutase
MLEMKITTKQQLMKLLAGSEIKLVVAMDIEEPDELNDLKKAGLKMLRTKPVTAFLVAN